jgi:hypothetical protein
MYQAKARREEHFFVNKNFIKTYIIPLQESETTNSAKHAKKHRHIPDLIANYVNSCATLF